MTRSHPDSQAKVVKRPYSTPQGHAAGGSEKNHPRPAPVFLPETLQVEAFHFSCPRNRERLFPLNNQGYENK